jgi:hypothetical protein
LRSAPRSIRLLLIIRISTNAYYQSTGESRAQKIPMWPSKQRISVEGCKPGSGANRRGKPMILPIMGGRDVTPSHSFDVQRFR